MTQGILCVVAFLMAVPAKEALPSEISFLSHVTVVL